MGLMMLIAMAIMTEIAKDSVTPIAMVIMKHLDLLMEIERAKGMGLTMAIMTG
jgi:hypothetical protein